jgi:hypothetical protein
MRQSRGRGTSRKVRRILLAATAGAILLPFAPKVMATTDSWKVTTGGNWSGIINWSAGVVPIGAQDVLITNAFTGSQTITFDSAANLTYASLTLDGTSGGTNVFLMPANNLATTGNQLVGFTGNAVFNQSGGANAVGATLYVGQSFASTGTYILGGGSLTAGTSEIIGNLSVGNFNQTGGTNSFNSSQLILGDNPSTSVGNYTLGAGALNLVSNSTEIIGSFGLGNFNQTGGAHSLSGGSKLVIGSNTFAVGNYTLGGGTLSVSNSVEYVGFAGTGNFNQTGGTHSLSGGSQLFLGLAPNSTGTYTLGAGASLNASSSYEYVGANTVGNFNQTGGTNSLSSVGLLVVGENANSTGTYTLAGGSLAAVSNTYEYVGNAGLGNFNQTGGVNSLSSGSQLVLGNSANTTGNYTLGAGGSLIANGATENIGASGVGNFNQTGGTNSLNGFSQLILGNTANSTGTYTLGAGASLNANSSSEYVGEGGPGVFNQTGGNHSLSNGSSLFVGFTPNFTGTYTLGAGASLNASSSSEYIGNQGLGIFNQTGGINSITGGGQVVLGSSAGMTGLYTLGTGAALNVSSSYENIGYAGIGKFNQTGGVNTLIGASNLSLGNLLGATGTYTLGAGASLNVISSSEYVGNLGLGIFNQTGGTNSITGGGQVVLAGNGDMTGFYTLGTGAALIVNNAYENIGYAGFGNFNQTGGVNSLSNASDLTLGNTPNSTGAYALGAGANLSVVSNSYELVGYGGFGNFNQTGGTNSLSSASQLVLGNNPNSTGTYTLAAGASLSAVSNSFEIIGYSGIGNFNQTGGVNTVSAGTQFMLGANANSTGTYTLGAGASLNANAASLELIGTFSGVGIFNQTGGINSLTSGSFLYVGDYFGSSGFYTLAAGSLIASDSSEFVGGYASGTFIQTGGSNLLTGNSFLSIAQGPPSTASYTMSGGTFSAPSVYLGGSNTGPGGQGLLTISGGQFTVTGNLIIDTFGTLVLAGGTLSTGGGTNTGIISGFGAFTGTGGFTNNNIFTQSGGEFAYSNAGNFTNAVGGNMNLANGHQFQINGAGNVLNFGSLALGGGTITGSGPGQMINESGGLLTGPGKILAGFSNLGTVEIGSGQLYLSPFTNLGDVQVEATLADLVGGAINNASTIEGFGLIGNAVNNQNTGTIEASGGTLNLAAPLINTGLLAVDSGGKLLLSGGLAANAGIISLTGGIFDTNNTPLNNTGQITGYGTIRTGGLTNNGQFNLTGGTSTVNGPVTNSFGQTINIKYQPAIFTGSVNNLGTIKTTGTTAIFSGPYSGNAYISDPSDNVFQNNVTVNSGGIMTGGNADRYFMSGGTFTNNGTFTNTGLLQSSDQINNTGVFTQTGTLLSSNSFTNSGTTTIGGTQTWTSGTTFTNTAGTSTFTSDTGSATSAPLSFSVTGGLLAITAPQAVASVSITGGKLDVNNTSLTINYGSAGAPNAMIRNYISSAYNVKGTLWTGTTGITSSVAAANPGHSSIGFADGADGVVTNLPAGVSAAVPAGGVLPTGYELITSAFPGDANLDGKVDFNDFVAISTHFLQPDIDWDHGNFNYDGVVDFNDFVVLSTNFGEGVTGGDGTGATAVELAQFNAMATSYGISKAQIAAWDATISTLPEPTSAGLLVACAVGLLQRRRRRRVSGRSVKASTKGSISHY